MTSQNWRRGLSSVTAFEAKTRFGELLDRASKGEEIVITKHNKAVARLIPEGANNSNVAGVVEELKALRTKIAAGASSRRLSEKEIKRAVNEGRR